MRKLTLLALTLTMATFNAVTYAAEEMTIGSAAPAIDVEHWLSTGDGKFEPFTEFEPGKVYIVEFWATWCGPCVASMPHLVETQEKYADKGLTIVSISDEPLDTVEKFLEGKVRGAQAAEGEVPTYGELTSAYCLTTDPDASVKKDYFLAAGQRGIPCAFIVGKDAHIEWIGHPMAMDDVLAEVLNDTWDRETFAIEFKAKQQFEKLTSMAENAAMSGDFETFDECIDQIKGLQLPAENAAQLPSILATLDVLKFAGLCINDSDKGLAQLAEQGESMSTSEIARLASILRVATARGKTVKPEVMQAIITQLESRVEGDENPAPLLNTIAALYHGQGDLDKAIEFQEKAVDASEAVPAMKQFMERSLKRFEDEKAKQEAAEDNA